MLLQGNQGQTGKQVGQNLTIGTGEFSEILATELQPRYYQNTYRGNTFGVLYAAGAAAAASATATGPFSFFNPQGSGKNLALIDATIVLVTFTAGVNGIQLALQPFAQTPTTVTAGNSPISTFIGGASNASVAKTYTAGTLVGASTTSFRFLGSIYIDLAAGDVIGSIKDEIAGAVVLAPGAGVNMVALVTVPTATEALALTWAELPI